MHRHRWVRSDYDFRLEACLFLVGKKFELVPKDVLRRIHALAFDPPHPGAPCLLLVSGLRTAVRKVSTGHAHVAFIDDRNRLYTTGCNLFNQCGRYRPAHIAEPVVVFRYCLDVACGSVFTAIVTNAKLRFCGGYNFDPSTAGSGANCGAICTKASFYELPFRKPLGIHARGGRLVISYVNMTIVLPILRGTMANADHDSADLAWGGWHYRVALSPVRVSRFLRRAAPTPACSFCGGASAHVSCLARALTLGGAPPPEKKHAHKTKQCPDEKEPDSPPSSTPCPSTAAPRQPCASTATRSTASTEP